MPVKVSRAGLNALKGVANVPHYDPSSVAPGIVHLGLGGFHRAHMARYTHELMQQDVSARPWGIIGVGMMPSDERNLQNLSAQDNLYTLVERDISETRIEIVGSIAGAIFAPSNPALVLDALSDPRISIVSLTVTQAGYCIDNGSKRLDLRHPMIAADLRSPGEPRSVIGLLSAAIERRRAAGTAPFAALSCDNIQANGDVLRQAVVDYTAALDPDLAGWIAANSAFPNTMVDRITPVTRPADREWLRRTAGIVDASPIFCEPFSQWVLEDKFPSGRPRWENAGALFVDDVRPFEFMKLRLLNATHLAIAAPGELLGYRLVDEALTDDRLKRFALAMMNEETGPTVPVPQGIDLDKYKNDILARFSNPTLKDTTERINVDASLNYLLDPLRDRLTKAEDFPLLSFAVACWVQRSCAEYDSPSAPPAMNATARELRKHGEEFGSAPETLLGHTPTFGDLSENRIFLAVTGGHLQRLQRDGIRTSIDVLAIQSARPRTIDDVRTCSAMD